MSIMFKRCFTGLGHSCSESALYFKGAYLKCVLQNGDEAKPNVFCIFKEYDASNYQKMLGLDCNAESMRVFREMF